MNIIAFKTSIKSIKWWQWILMGIMMLIALRALILPSSNPTWLDAINFVSAICGIFCVFLCAEASVSNFVFGLVNTIVYIIYLWYWKIYGTFFLEIFVYLPITAISWWRWSKHRDVVKPELAKAKRLSSVEIIFVFGAVVSTTALYYVILKAVGGTVPLLDALTVSLGIIAVILEWLRYREQYILWNIQNIIAVIMYAVHFDPVYLTKKSIYLIMSVYALFNWWRLSKNNKENE